MTFFIISGQIKFRFPAFKATIIKKKKQQTNVPYRVRVSCFYFFLSLSDSPDEYARYYKVLCFVIVKKK